MNLEPALTVPQERYRPHTDYAVCLICQKGPDSQRGPLQKLTSQGYPAFLYAVNNRKDEVSFRLESDVDTQSDFLAKNPMYHARCRSNYTNRKTVDQKKACLQSKRARRPPVTLQNWKVLKEQDRQPHKVSTTKTSASYVEKHAVPKETDVFF